MSKGADKTSSSNQMRSDTTASRLGQTRDTSQLTPWGAAATDIDYYLGRGRKLFEDKVGQQYFPGQRVVPFAPQSKSAFGQFGAASRMAAPVVQSAAGANAGITSGSNPFLSQIGANPHRDAAAANIVEGIQDSHRRGFASQNLAGSSLESKVMGESIGKALADFNLGVYNADQQNALQAAGLQQQAAREAASIAGGLGVPAGFNRQVGQTIEDKGQHRIDQDIRAYLYGQERPYALLDQLGRYAGDVGQAFGRTDSSRNYAEQISEIVKALESMQGKQRSSLFNKFLGTGNMFANVAGAVVPG